MPEITVELEVFCSTCGSELTTDSETESPSGYSNNHAFKVTVSPCGKCLEERFEEGKEEGKEEGIEQGKKEGKEEAEEAKKEGVESGN